MIPLYIIASIGICTNDPPERLFMMVILTGIAEKMNYVLPIFVSLASYVFFKYFPSLSKLITHSLFVKAPSSLVTSTDPGGQTCLEVERWAQPSGSLPPTLCASCLSAKAVPSLKQPRRTCSGLTWWPRPWREATPEASPTIQELVALPQRGAAPCETDRVETKRRWLAATWALVFLIRYLLEHVKGKNWTC